MRKTILITLCMLFVAGCAWAQFSSVAPGFAIQEEDGSPDTTAFVLKVGNGDLTDNGDGTVSLATGGGSGTTDDDVTVNSTAVDTTANFLDNTTIEFDITDGGAGGPDDITGTLVADGVGHIALNDVDTPADGEVLSYQASSERFEWVANAGGGSVGGSNTELLFNNASSEDGASTLKFTDATKTLTNTGTFKSTTGYIVGSGLDQNEDLIV